jgi:hypothetical protein
VKLGFTVCKSAESLVRKPGAGESHTRFDERDLETETRSDIQTPTTERVGSQLRLNLPPPRQISTLLRTGVSRIALTCDFTPLISRSSVQATTTCAATGETEYARRENFKILFTRHEMIKSFEREFGVTLSNEVKRETTVRTEPHPTRSFYQSSTYDLEF